MARATGDGNRCTASPLQIVWLCQTPVSGCWPCRSGKGAVHLEPATVTHEMESGARKFVRDSLERDHPRLARSVALIPGLYGRGEPDCEVGRFDPRPGQVAVSAFSVAGALALAVGDFVGRHQPAVGGVLANVIEALDLATLKRDRQTKDDPDARNRT